MGTTLNLYGGWTNHGTIVAGGSSVGLGSLIDINPTSAAAAPYIWTNNGKLTIAGGATVNLGGIITTDEYLDNFADIGVTADLVKDAVNLTGSLDNSPADNPQSGGVLAVDASTGPLPLEGGEIYQGLITTSGNNDLVATTQGGTLDGVTLDGTLDMTEFQGNSADVVGGLILNGLIDLGGAAGPELRQSGFWRGE